MGRSSDTALAFLLGAVTGGIVALLLAPEKGEVTRRKIRDGATDVYGKGRNWAGGRAQGLRGKAGDAGSWVKEKAGDVTEIARTQMESVKAAVSEGKEAYRREMEKGQSPGNHGA